MATAVSAGGQNAVQLRIGSIAHPIALEAEIGKLEEADWFACTSCGYASENEARGNGELLRNAFILAGAIKRLGVDAGFGRYTVRFGELISDAHRESTARELRGSIHGVDVFEKDKVTLAVASRPRLRALNSIEALQKSIQDAMSFCAGLSARQEICASLINDSFFVANQDVRFVMLVCAVEALCDQRVVSDSYRSLIDLVLKCLSKLEGPEAEKKELLSKVLSNQKRESIGEAYRSKITSLLSHDKAKKFGELYTLRSKYLHDGKGRGEVGKRAEEAFQIAAELLEADTRAAHVPVRQDSTPPLIPVSPPHTPGSSLLSRLAMLVFIVLPVAVVALGVAVAAILALGWLIQHATFWVST